LVWKDSSVGDPSATLAAVSVGVLRPERFESILPKDAYGAFMEAVRRGGEIFAGRVVWNVNSTARGGGVAEMLRSLIAYARGAGVDARWVVIGGDARFFEVTKRLHNHLHGYRGDGGPLGEKEDEAYRATATANAEALAAMVQAGDVIILHDPQTAGLCGPIKEAGAIVLWRCHVGLDAPNDLARQAWDFLRPHVVPADVYVFSRDAYVWEGLDRDRAVTIPPSIDAFSPKNQDLEPEQVRSILLAAGLFAGEPTGPPSFVHEDGSSGIVRRTADLSGGAPAADFETPVVVQVSRWDRLKDPLGVIKGYAEHIAPSTEAHLVLAGPSVDAVADDPEGAAVLAECEQAWSELPKDISSRVHLACLPMDDGEENAAIVNALQRRANVMVQKSLAEGFGLTVAEAMWKARPVVASKIGGIQDQVTDGETAILVDPEDLAAYGRAVTRLLENPSDAVAMGKEAQRRIRDLFLAPRHLMQYLEVIQPLLR
jgi:trehalose synthase